MIVLITARGHGTTLRCVVEDDLGAPAPTFRTMQYEHLFGTQRVPRATYIFGDLERLAPWELQFAADLYRAMTKAGLRCLNNPAKAMTRAELLTALHAAGINPFGVARADTDPRPARFPVFIRAECSHLPPSDELYGDQSALDRKLRNLRDEGTPLRGTLVIEHAAERYSDTLWAKWGTWRIGDEMIVDHIAVDAGTWMVKGRQSHLTEAAIADEHDAVVSNRFAADLRKSFEIGCIEFGRADHAAFGGRTIVYEINTNPYLSGFSLADSHALRRQTERLARKRIADALHAIDTSDAGSVRLPSGRVRWPLAWWRPGFMTPRRP